MAEVMEDAKADEMKIKMVAVKGEGMVVEVVTVSAKVQDFQAGLDYHRTMEDSVGLVGSGRRMVRLVDSEAAIHSKMVSPFRMV
jgi:hypothetical protein